MFLPFRADASLAALSAQQGCSAENVVSWATLDMLRSPCPESAHYQAMLGAAHLATEGTQCLPKGVTYSTEAAKGCPDRAAAPCVHIW